jgi:hypothetical protein
MPKASAQVCRLGGLHGGDERTVIRETPSSDRVAPHRDQLSTVFQLAEGLQISTSTRMLPK